MAWKTPGVYFTEIDNTDYTNPAASVSTTVAIIGFAKKGPIGVPIEIKTYNDYKSIFGTPIAGQYAGLAVRSVLSAGGIVLYTRIADETIASKSNVIVKNGTEAVDGAIIINKASDIAVGTDGYELGKTYAGKIATSEGLEKTLIVRTPAEGKLKVSSLAKQFKDSLNANFGREEFSVPKKIPYTSVRNFNIAIYNEGSSDEDKEPFGPYFVNVKGADLSTGKVSNLVSNIKAAIEAGPSAYQKIYIFGNREGALLNDGDMSTAKFLTEESKLDFQLKYKIKSVNAQKEPTELTKRISVNSVELVENDETHKYIYISDIVNALNDTFEKESICVRWCYNDSGLTDQDTDGTYGYLLFASFGGDKEIDIRPSFKVNNTTSNSLFVPARMYDGTEEVEEFKYVSDTYVSGTSENPNPDYFEYNEYVKLNKEETGFSFDNISYVRKDNAFEHELNIDSSKIFEDKDAFDEATASNPEAFINDEVVSVSNVLYNVKITTVGEDDDAHKEFALEAYTPITDSQVVNGLNGLFVRKKQCVKNTGKTNIDVEYLEDVKTLVFSINGDDENFQKTEGSTIEISRTNFGGYLFDDDHIIDTDTEDKSTEALITENKKAVGKKIAAVKGEKALALDVEIDSNQIKFIEEGNIIPGTINTTDKIGTIEGIDGVIEDSGYLTLDNLIGTPMTSEEFNSNGYTNTFKCVVYKEGSAELDPSKKDVIVFTAREYGEGTSTGIRVYTSVSPVDGTKTHYIETIVGGVVKETWEDVSYNPADDNYFKDLINEEPENSGSSYIKVDVIKNDTTTEEVMLPDTAELTGSDTPIYIGKPISSSSINRADTEGTELDGTSTGKPVAVTDYMSYDYMIGDNGIPDDSADLFMEAMDTEKSGLCNKDLYYWHILITPDNITEEVQDCAIKFCEFMDDAIYIADPPQGISRENVVKWHNGAFGRGSAIQSDFACTYWPWLKVYDSNESKYVWCMPSVLMAAQFCKVDNNYAPWYAPAGETNGLISQAVDLETYPNKTDRDEMYLDQNRVNPFLMMKNGNILAYGEKTLKRKNSTLTKIHTRRMLIALKHQLRNSIKGFIFMPTAAENISKIRGIATSIMEDVKIGGGISSYRVICDGTNNTTETLQQDILNLDIVCVPTGCIEQVNISFTLNKSES